MDPQSEVTIERASAEGAELVPLPSLAAGPAASPPEGIADPTQGETSKRDPSEHESYPLELAAPGKGDDCPENEQQRDTVQDMGRPHGYSSAIVYSCPSTVGAFVRASKAESTLRGYRADWHDFCG
jgi:hypothetical protein